MYNSKYISDTQNNANLTGDKDGEKQQSDQKESGKADLDSIKEYGQMPLPDKKKNPKGTIHCLSIIGQVEGHISLPPQNKTTKYEHIIPQLVSICDNPEIDGILIVLNTVGGDVEAGLAIAELISSMGKPTVSIVLGGGHSIGVPLGVASDYTFIAKSATMTIHPIRMNGTIIGVSQTYDYFERMQERILEFVTHHSHIKKDRLKELMLDTGQLAKDVGTILVGEEAVKEKIIDSVGGLDDAINKLYDLIQRKKQSKTEKKRKLKSNKN